MKNFTATFHCVSGAHCSSCRNDPKWRKLMERDFVMPDECPYPAIRDKNVITIPANAGEACDQCDRRNCPNVSCVSCGGGQELHIQYPCPRGSW